MKLKFLFVFTLILLVTTETKSFGICSVQGRAIDENDSPVPKAIIMFGREGGNYGDVVEISFAFEDGYFYHSASCQPKERLYLLVFPPTIYDTRYFVPITESLVGNKNHKSLSGLRLKKEYSNVGNVRVTQYRKVKIKFVKMNGEPLFSNKKEWLEKMIRIRTFKNKFAMEGYVSQKDIENSSDINMYLPDGKWKFDIILDGDDGGILFADKIVNVVRMKNEEIQELSLKMSEKNKN